MLSMSGSTKRGEIFKKIHAPLYKYLKDKMHYSNKGEYYLVMYAWYEDFYNDIIKLRQISPESYCNYLKRLFYSGLLRLDFSQQETIWDKDNYIVWLLNTKKNRSVPYSIPSSFETRNTAATYLEKTFSSLSEFDFKQLVEIGLSQIEELSSEHGLILRNIATEEQLDDYQMLANIVIYAQNQTLLHSVIEKNFPPSLPNIYMASKEKIQDLFPLDKRSAGAKRLVLINYAGTSFICGRAISDDVKNTWNLFLHNMYCGEGEVNVVLTKPGSPAAKDAEMYKMRPSTLKIPVQQIIETNIEDLLRTKAKYPDFHLNLFFTDVALPCAYFKSEFENPEFDNIKIDLYLPSFTEYEETILEDSGKHIYQICNKEEADGILRQSFMIFRKENEELYQTFSNNIEQILRHSEPYSFAKEDSKRNEK